MTSKAQQAAAQAAQQVQYDEQGNPVVLEPAGEPLPVYGAEGELSQEELEVKEAEEAEANTVGAPELQRVVVTGYSDYAVETNSPQADGVEAAIRADEASATTPDEPVRDEPVE